MERAQHGFNKSLCIWCCWRAGEWRRAGGSEEQRKVTNKQNLCCQQVASSLCTQCTHTQQPNCSALIEFSRSSNSSSLVFANSQRKRLNTQQMTKVYWDNYLSQAKQRHGKMLAATEENREKNWNTKRKRWNQQDLCTCVAWLSVRWRGNALSNSSPALAASAQKLIYLFTYEKVKPGKNFACSSRALVLFCAGSPFLCSRTIEDTRIVCSFWFHREFSLSLTRQSPMFGENFSLEGSIY